MSPGNIPSPHPGWSKQNPENRLLETVGGVRELTADRDRTQIAGIGCGGFTAPKLLWMRRHEPELFAKLDKTMLPKDYVNYTLTGVHSRDYSDASGTLLQYRKFQTLYPSLRSVFPILNS